MLDRKPAVMPAFCAIWYFLMVLHSPNPKIGRLQNALAFRQLLINRFMIWLLLEVGRPDWPLLFIAHRKA